MDYFDPAPAPAIERLARIEGQSNFLSLLGGATAGPDITPDLLALGYAQLNGRATWLLEAYYAQSRRHDDRIVRWVWGQMRKVTTIKESDRLAARTAIYAALRQLQGETSGSLKRQASALGISDHTYAPLRRLASAIMGAAFDDAHREWEEIRGVRHR